MQKMLVPLTDEKRNILQWTLVALCCIAVFTRIYLYIYPKDLWLDERWLFEALYQGTWQNILHCQLAFGQCCPLLFAIYNKLLFSFSTTQYALYFLPTCTGIALIFMFVALAQKIDGKLYAIVCLFCFCALKTFIYYSSEYKQYILEAFMTVSVIYIYIYDLSSGDERRFISWKYPLLMSISLLLSSPSVFISAGLATTTAFYLRCEKAFRLQRIFIVFLTRYSLYGIVCLVYYFLYLKNGDNALMQEYWQRYFFPTTLSAWPDYIENIFFTGRGLLEASGRGLIKCLGLLPVPLGIYFLWRKNRFTACALTMPFLFAAIAGFHFYPLIIGASIGSRLSLYLLPLILLLSGQGVLPLARFLVNIMPVKLLILCSCVLAGSILCLNIFFAARGMGYEHASPATSALPAPAAVGYDNSCKEPKQAWNCFPVGTGMQLSALRVSSDAFTQQLMH